MRIIARFEKTEPVRFISHLDIQRLFQRAFRRADMPLAYSQGFNPHPLLAFATALSVGYTSSAEWLDIKLAADVPPEQFQQAVNDALPAGFRILETLEAEDKLPALSALMAAADHTVWVENGDALRAQAQALLDDPIMVEKRTKGGIKTVSLRPMLYDLCVETDRLRIRGCLDAQGSLNIDLLLGALMRETGPFAYTVHRDMIYSKDGLVMPALAAAPALAVGGSHA